jgi:hypothetical protein
MINACNFRKKPLAEPDEGPEIGKSVFPAPMTLKLLFSKLRFPLWLIAVAGWLVASGLAQAEPSVEATLSSPTLISDLSASRLAKW